MLDSLINRVLDAKWAMTPSALEQLIRVVLDDYNAADLARAMHSGDVSQWLTEDKKFDFSAIVARDDDRLQNTYRATRRDGVAIIPVVGPIFPRSNLFTSFSGATSISTLAKDFQTALDDDGIHSIIFNMDTPGGEITGVSELAQMIFAAQGQKDILTYVYGWGASAGYWIGSASSEIIVADTAEVGSIGVVTTYVDDREALKKRGFERVQIVSSQSPNKRLDPQTNEGRTQIQTIIDQLADVFVSAVAKHRGTESQDVLDNFGRGGMIVAANAVELGMADRIGSLEGIIAEQIEQHTSTFQGGFTMSLTAQEVREKHPAVYQEILSEGVKQGKGELDKAVKAAHEEGAKEENARIQSIEGIKAPGFESVIAENKFDRSQTKDTIAGKVLDAQTEKATAAGDKVQKDAHNLAQASTGIGAEQSSSADADKTASEDAAIIEAMSRGANSRGEKLQPVK